MNDPRLAPQSSGASTSGVAMTEFALLLPMMVLLYFGTIEITQGIIIKRMVNQVVRTLSDLTSRVKIATANDVEATFSAAQAIMAPLDTTDMKMRITSVIVSPAGTTCVDWSVGKNMAARTRGAAVTIPASLTTVTTEPRNFIMAEAEYTYTPIWHYVVPGSITLEEGPSYMMPRQSDRVAADTTIQTPASSCP